MRTLEMERPQEHDEARPGRKTVLLVLGLVCAVIAAGAALAALAGDVPGPRLAARVFPARVVSHLEGAPPPAGTGTWTQPADFAAVDGRWFLLDTGSDRILELNASGTVLQVLDARRDERLSLAAPMAMAVDANYLYVANSGRSEVLVLEPDGRVVRTIFVGATQHGDLPARPIGVVVAPGGDVIVSDAANHRVLRYGRHGDTMWAAGTGARAAGKDGFNTPAGLTLDGEGNILVVDILNGRVVKLSPGGSFLGQYGRLGDTAGALSRPKDVAVDGDGNVYVSDGLQAAVHVFAPEGDYRGFIGPRDGGDRDSAAMFKAPAGLAIEGERLYVADRFAGLFLFDLPSR